MMHTTKDTYTGKPYRYDTKVRLYGNPDRTGPHLVTVGRCSRSGLSHLHPSRLTWAKFRELNPGLYWVHTDAPAGAIPGEG